MAGAHSAPAGLVGPSGRGEHTGPSADEGDKRGLCSHTCVLHCYVQAGALRVDIMLEATQRQTGLAQRSFCHYWLPGMTATDHRCTWDILLLVPLFIIHLCVWVLLILTISPVRTEAP